MLASRDYDGRGFFEVSEYCLAGRHFWHCDSQYVVGRFACHALVAGSLYIVFYWARFVKCPFCASQGREVTIEE
jgi:hypothetical protein